MSSEFVAAQAVNGIVLGSTYALVSVGYSLVFGVLKKVNFANGSVFVVGSFSSAYVLVHTGSLLLTLASGLGVGFLSGVITQLASFKYTEKSGDELFPAMSSVALGMVMIELCSRAASAPQISMPEIVNTAAVNFSIFSVSKAQVLVVAVAFAALIVLELGLRRTRIGLDARALAEDVMMAKLMGIPTSRVVMIVFGISGALAGLGGLLQSARLGLADIGSGFDLGMASLAIMVIAGLGDIRGAMWTALLMGFVTVISLSAFSTQVAVATPWLLLLLVLSLKPRGIFGRATW